MIKKLVWAAYKTKRDCDLNLHHAAVVTLDDDIQREWRESLAVWLEYAILNSLTGSQENVCAWVPTTYFLFL